jgi:hypothetical protein
MVVINIYTRICVSLHEQYLISVVLQGMVILLLGVGGSSALQSGKNNVQALRGGKHG